MTTYPNLIDPFSIDSLLILPDLDFDVSTVWQNISTEVDVRTKTLGIEEVKGELLQDLQAAFFRLDLEDVPLPDLASSISSGHVSDGEETFEEDRGSVAKEELEDIWTLPDILGKKRTNQLLSWDQFLDEGHVESSSAYVSEEGGGAFNAIIRATSNDEDRPVSRLARVDILLSSLFELGMGRDSAFYYYDEARQTFSTIEQALTVLGISAESCAEVVAHFIGTGNCAQRLRRFIDTKFRGQSSIEPIRLALASSINTLLHVIEQYVEDGRTAVESILQLQTLFYKPSILVEILCQLVDACRISTSIGVFLQSGMGTIHEHIERHPWIEQPLQNIFATICKPVLEELEAGIGLSPSATLGWIAEDDQKSDTLALQAFAPEISAQAAEVRSSIKLLRMFSPGHALSSKLLQAFPSGPRLELCFSWSAICHKGLLAREYETTLMNTVLDRRKHPISNGQETVRPEAIGIGWSPFSTKTVMGVSFDLEPRPGRPLVPGDPQNPYDILQTTRTCLWAENADALDLKPSVAEAFTMSLSPLLTAQHRLVSYAGLQYLFQVGHLRTHFAVLYRFQLFGDRRFTSRLSEALFDSNQASCEARQDINIANGLRLQSRDTWPPASSELRLVLMDVLSESISGTVATDAKIKDSIAFAIRDLPDEQLEMCRKVDSVHALDFLRLQYKPANPAFETFLTASSLRKYDRISQHLLRLLRVQSTAQNLIRDVSNRHCHSAPKHNDHRLRIEIYHFIMMLADYSHSIAIGLPWAKFDTILREIEQSLDQGDYEGTLHQAGCLGNLRSLHECMLDEMTRALFLKKSQLEVRTLLDRLFDIVLRFATLLRKRRNEVTDNEVIARMRDGFKQCVSSFLTSLRAQSSGPRMASDDTVGGDNPFKHLLIRIDLLGYWSEKTS